MITIPFPGTAPSKEYLLNVRAVLIKAEPLLQEGFIVTSDQFLLAEAKVSAIEEKVKGKLKTSILDNRLIISGVDFSYGFDLTSGQLSSIKFNDEEIMKQGLKANFWRAPIDNDFGNRMPERQEVWKLASNEQKLKEMVLNPGKLGLAPLDKGLKSKYREVEITALFDLPDVEGSLKIIYTVNVDGSMDISTSLESLEAGLIDLPRFGNYFALNDGFNKVEYYGRGPHENYWDRKTSAVIGIYQSTVGDMGFDYIRPQENGQRTDTRWLTLTNEKQIGIKITGKLPFEFNLQHNLINDLDPGMKKQQRHPYEVEKRRLTAVAIDYHQMGVGGDNSWGARPLRQYTLPAKNYNFSFRITPLLTGGGHNN